MYSNIMALDRLLFELSCTNPETHTHTDFDEYPIVAFCKKATITSTTMPIQGSRCTGLESIVKG